MIGVLETVQVTLDAAYLLHVPRQVDEHTNLVLTLHGYGSNPEAMLRLTSMSVGENCLIASLRGPNQHYLSGNLNSDQISYNWGTRPHSDANVPLHHRIVQAVSSRVRGQFGIPVARTILMGFSQPVGLNYRFIGTYPTEAAGVIGICGGVPKDWEGDGYRPVGARILHISRSEDEFFPAEVARGFPGRLRHHAADVEFHMLPGTHRFPSKAVPLIQAWMTRLFGSKRL
jgi:predicted esterase